MYRAAAYNPFKESIYLRTWTEDGDRIDTEIPFKPYLYLEKEGATDGVSIFKTSLHKKTFKNSLERKRFVDNSSNTRIFYNLPPEQQFLIDTFKDQNGDPDFSRFPLKMFLFDIEVDTTCDPGHFPTPERAAVPINLITVYDSITKVTHTWGLKESYEPTLPDCIYHRCKTEQDLILQFVDFWKSDYPEIVTGWNSTGFDIPYIINRFAKIFGEDFIKQLSPVGSIRSRKVFNDSGKELTLWSIGGIASLDYMDLYKTFSPGERESFSLNYISELELGEGKIAYNAVSLGELAHTDWKLFVDYNIQDVHLLVKLEEKLKFLEIARMLSYKGCTNFEAALGKVSIVTGVVAIQASKQGQIIPTFVGSADRESYEGGFVRDPDKGIQKAIVSFDVNSLYPNTIITLNISPETKLGKIIEGDQSSEFTTIRLLNGNIHKVPSSKLSGFLTSNKISLSQAGVLYSQKTKGIIPTLIDRIYQERVEAKEQLSKLKKSGKKDRETLLKITYFDTLQYTIKILLNSVYGTFANKFSSLMDIDNAMSITLTGQSVARAGSSILDDYAKRVYGVNESITKYGDTDSVVGETVIQTNIGSFPIEYLYDNFKNSKKFYTFKGHEIIDIQDDHIKVPTFDTNTNKAVWGDVKNMIRHKVSKKKYRIVVDGKEVIMTEDHGCMVLRDGDLIRIAPRDINICTDEMITMNEDLSHDIVDITSVECIGTFDDEYVYDIEMSDDTEHTFFANNVLVHNSVYISIDPILKKLNIPLTTDGQITPAVHDIVNDLDKCVNTEILEWARRDLYSTDPRFVFKREIISDVGIFLQKKRYILHVLDEEGTPVDKFKYTGIELVRSTTPKKVKKFIEAIIKTSLLTQDVKKTNEVYRNSYEEFQKLDPNDVAARTTINNLERYAEGASLYKYNNKTPSHVKGAIAYNILIKEHKIDDRYEAIQSAQKVKKLYCTKNKYGLTVISYVSTLPQEFGINPDWDKMFMKLVTQPTERLYQAIGWVLPEIGKEVQTDLFEMFGM
jgi:DNA polymerase elongation subunit (family B)